MTIAPIVRSVSVSVPPERAFALFTGSMGEWWKKGRTIGKQPHVAIVVEPHTGGRWFERDADGHECDWGNVLAWDPPHRLLLAWHLDASFSFDPDFETEVELSFEPEGDGTRVTLEHRNLERFGDRAREVAAKLDGGWPTHLEEFSTYANQEETAK